MKRVAALLLGWAAVAAGSVAAESPRVSYMLHCMGCHLMDGRGMPPEVPSLAGRVGYYLDLPEGRRYLVQVPGAAQSLLNDSELADVLNWILAELGGESVEQGFDAFTAAEVGRYRRRAPDDVGPLRRRLQSRMDP